MSTVLVGRVRLAPVIAIAVGSIAAALMLLARTSTVSTAIVLLALAGLAQGMIDSSGQILLQRSTSPHRLASVFALVEILVVVGTVVGTVAAQVAVTSVGASDGLILLGGGLLLVLLVTARQLWRADRSADVPVVSIALMRSMPLFAPLPPAAIEAVARAARERSFEPGDVIIREGDEGHSYFVIVDGEVDVSVRNAFIRSRARGEGVGEVALLAEVPRSATVQASTEVRVLEIDRGPFLLAVTGNDAALTAAWQRIRGLDGIDHLGDLHDRFDPRPA